MLKIISNKNLLIILSLWVFSSCSKFVDSSLPDNLLSSDKVFTAYGTANSAIYAIYGYMPTNYSVQYFTYLGGLASDEMQYTGTSADLIQFQQNTVSSQNSTNESYLWTYPYMGIRYVNAAVAGLEASTQLTESEKNPLLGEAKFMRAWYYFNLVNYLGKPVLITNNAPLSNTETTNSDSATVYAQIVSDLVDAENLMETTYPGSSTLKVRANKWAAAALLSRVYLYQKMYQKSLDEANKIINSGTYSLANPDSAFINTSKETILQFSTTYGYSTIGTNYRTTSDTNNVAPPTFVISATLVHSFDTSDLRYKDWIDSTVYNGKTYYRNYKYKLKTATAGNEYNVMLRYAELWLNKAEDELNLGNNTEALNALNVIRQKNGLQPFTNTNTSDLLNEILDERKKEFFGESAMRWFDLKRMGIATSVLSSIKSAWTADDVWMPIPYNQIILNSNLTQNNGY